MMDSDYESLKEAAERMIRGGPRAGLNPHKVKRLCEEYGRLKEMIHQNCEMVSSILKSCDHETDYRQGDKIEKEEIYFVPESLLLKILEDDRKVSPAGSERSHDKQTLQAAYNKGFEDARKQILEKVNRLREEVMR